MKKADKEYFDSCPDSVDTVLKVDGKYFIPSEAVKAKVLSTQKGLNIEILKRKEEIVKVEKPASRKKNK